MAKCICGRPTRLRKDGKEGTTCGNPRCAGRTGKAAYEKTVLQGKCWFSAPGDHAPYYY